MSGLVLALYMHSHFLLTITLWDCITDEDTKAKTGLSHWCKLPPLVGGRPGAVIIRNKTALMDRAPSQRAFRRF